MQSESNPQRLWGRDFLIIMVASTGISFCNYFFSSTLPIFATQLSGTTATAGLMMGAYTFTSLIVRPLSGSLSDRFGRTRLLVAGALLCSLACALYHFAGLFVLLILFRALHGVGFGIHSTCAGAMAADVIPPSRRSEGIGFFGMYSTVAAAIAPGIALAIIGTGTLSGFQRLFTLAALISLGSMLADTFIRYERRDRAAGQQPAQRQTSQTESAALPPTLFGFEYAVFQPVAVLVLVYFALSSVASFLAMFALQRGLGNVGVFFSVNAAGLLVSRLFLGKVADQRGEAVVVIPGILLLALSLALIPGARSLPLLCLLAFPIGLAQGSVGPSINALMFNRCTPQRRGTASAAYFSSIDIGYGLGSIAFGLVAANFGYTAVYLIAALSCLLALPVYLTGTAQRKRVQVRAQ